MPKPNRANAALIALAKSIAVQDEFTYTASASEAIQQAYDLINAWRNKAHAALALLGRDR